MGLTPSYYNNLSDYPERDTAPIGQAPSLTYALELDGDRCQGAKDGIDALLQAIYMTLRTERGRYVIYPRWFGLQTMDLYGRPRDFIFAELSARIRDALMLDDRILDVRDFTILADRSDDTDLCLAYTVVSKYGAVGASGVYRIV